ncbi:MAG: DUF6265 family protein [Bacteroidota bacterium]
MKSKAIFIFFLFATFLVNAQIKEEQLNSSELVKLFDKSKPPAKIELSKLDWMKGTWQAVMKFWEGDTTSIFVEHIILPEEVAQMPGFVRAMRKNSITFYEITQFIKVGASVSYRVKHFSGDLKGWEPQNEYIDRPLVEATPTTLYFDGITFQRKNHNNFTVYFLIQHGQDKGTILEIPFRKV